MMNLKELRALLGEPVSDDVAYWAKYWKAGTFTITCHNANNCILYSVDEEGFERRQAIRNAGDVPEVFQANLRKLAREEKIDKDTPLSFFILNRMYGKAESDSDIVDVHTWQVKEDISVQMSNGGFMLQQPDEAETVINTVGQIPFWERSLKEKEETKKAAVKRVSKRSKNNTKSKSSATSDERPSVAPEEVGGAVLTPEDKSE